MSESKQRDDVSSVRSNEVEIWTESYPDLIAPEVPQRDIKTLWMPNVSLVNEMNVSGSIFEFIIGKGSDAVTVFPPKS